MAAQAEQESESFAQAEAQNEMPKIAEDGDISWAPGLVLRFFYAQANRHHQELYESELSLAGFGKH